MNRKQSLRGRIIGKTRNKMMNSKENKMLKRGDRVEVRDGNDQQWYNECFGDKYYYVAEMREIGGKKNEYPYIIIDSFGAVYCTKQCRKYEDE